MPAAHQENGMTSAHSSMNDSGRRSAYRALTISIASCMFSTTMIGRMGPNICRRSCMYMWSRIAGLSRVQLPEMTDQDIITAYTRYTVCFMTSRGSSALLHHARVRASSVYATSECLYFPHQNTVPVSLFIGVV